MLVIEHEKRKHEILQKALDVFIEEGYEDANFQKIAERCGLTRTTLYIYFKNKHEIFLGSIKELLSNLEISLNKIIEDDNPSAEVALRDFCGKILDECSKNSKLFSVLLTYLLQIKKAGANTDEKVRRRVIRMRHHISSLIIRGIQNGEFRNISVKDANELLYSLIESLIFKMTVLGTNDISSMKDTMNFAIDGILNKNR